MPNRKCSKNFKNCIIIYLPFLCCFRPPGWSQNTSETKKGGCFGHGRGEWNHHRLLYISWKNDYQRKYAICWEKMSSWLFWIITQEDIHHLLSARLVSLFWHFYVFHRFNQCSFYWRKALLGTKKSNLFFVVASIVRRVFVFSFLTNMIQKLRGHVVHHNVTWMIDITTLPVVGHNWFEILPWHKFILLFSPSARSTRLCKYIIKNEMIKKFDISIQPNLNLLKLLIERIIFSFKKLDVTVCL